MTLLRNRLKALKGTSKVLLILGLLIPIIASILWFFFSWRSNTQLLSPIYQNREWQLERAEIRAQLSWLDAAVEQSFNQNEVNRIYTIIKTSLKTTLNQDKSLKDEWLRLEPLVLQLGEAVFAEDTSVPSLIVELKRELEP